MAMDAKAPRGEIVGRFRLMEMRLGDPLEECDAVH